MMREHKLDFVAETDEHIEIACEVCGRRIRLLKAGGLTIVEKGDQEVNHGSFTHGSHGSGFSLEIDVSPAELESVH